MKKMKNALLPTCLQISHSRMSSQTFYGMPSTQNNELDNGGSEEYIQVSNEPTEALHQRYSSKSSGTSSVDTFTLKARMENLEIALTMLRENFQRMEHAMNKQIEKAIELIVGRTKVEETEEVMMGPISKCHMKKENKKLLKAVKFLTESSRIMRTALSEHTQVIDHLSYVINQPTESNNNMAPQRRDESPVERIVNKYKKQRDKVQIVYPKALNPLEVSDVVSDYLAVEDTPRHAYSQMCKLNHTPTVLNNKQSPTCLYVNFNKDKNTFLQCNCRICALKPSTGLAFDPDGDYVTLIRNYITTGKCDAAYEYFNKTSLPDLTAHTNINISFSDANDEDEECDVFKERQGTLV